MTFARFSALLCSLLTFAVAAPNAVAAAADPWRAIEEGWIWQVVQSEQTLAGSWNVGSWLLADDVTYEMTFDVSDVEGRTCVFLGDNPCALIMTTGSHRYTFTANERKRMVFRTARLENGRAKLAASNIRVRALANPDTGSSGAVRIAYSADGNQHDADDWAASPLALAMIADEAGYEIVHFDYNNHLGDNDAQRAQSHRAAVEGAVERYGFDASMFFDHQQASPAATDHLAEAINASTAGDRLHLVCAGPMETCWRALDAAQPEQRGFVTLITHSWWNNTHDDTPELAHTLTDIANDFPTVEIRQIANQNETAFRSPREDWAWLQQHGDNGWWLYEQITAGSRPAHPGDASDAGMVYYVLDGMRWDSDDAQMWEIRQIFNN